MKRAYLDSNIILAYAAGPIKEPEQYSKAKKIFEEIKSNQFIGIISILTLMETLGVMRAQKAREKEQLLGLDRKDQLYYVLKESKEMYDVTTHEILQMPNVKLEAGKVIDMKKLFEMAYEIMLQVRGNVKFRRYCKKCGSDNSFFDYKGLGTDDIIHILLAKEIGCDIFITFDSDFGELINHEKIEPIEIRLLRW